MSSVTRTKTFTTNPLVPEPKYTRREKILMFFGFETKKELLWLNASATKLHELIDDTELKSPEALEARCSDILARLHILKRELEEVKKDITDE